MPAKTTLTTVHEHIHAGDIPQARALLKSALAQQPTADLYYAAALVATSTEQARGFLRQAMALDPLHTDANRLHSALQQQGGAAIRAARARLGTASPSPKRSTLLVPEITPEAIRAKQRKRRRRWVFNPLTFVSVLVLSLSMSWLTMLLLGVGSAYTSRIAELFGGSAAVTTVDGVPITEVRNPARSLAVPVAYEDALERGGENALGEVLRDGVLHQYTFQGERGEELAIAVQFFSPFAENVAENVAVFDPEPKLAGNRCQRDFIIDRQTGVVFICRIDVSGAWRVRVFGQEGQSTGVYIVTVDRLEP